MDCIELSRSKVVRVYGPAKLTVEKGVLLSAGYTVSEGSEIVVRSTRGASLYALESSRVCYTVGSSGLVKVEETPRFNYSNWMGVLDSLAEQGARRIVVVGPPDSGKSTLSLWLRNRLEVCLVEADVGQNEFGLPGMVAASRFDGVKYPTINDVLASRAWFVGHVSADKALDAIVAAVVGAAKWCSEYVIDTDGYVQGRGLVYKVSVVRALSPDAVVVMGDKGLAERLKPFVDAVVVAERPPVRERDRVDRKAYRERAYANLFRDTERLTLSLSETVLVNHEDCTVEPLERGAILRCADRIYATDRYAANRVEGASVRLLRKGWERGLLVGIESDVLGEAPGILESLDYVRGKIVVRVPRGLVKRKPSYVILGYVRIDPENLTELERIEPASYPTAIVRSAAARTRSR